MVEIWKNIKGFDDAYSVSTFGRVKNNRTDHILTPNLHKKKGYLFIVLSKMPIRRKTSIHRLVAETFIPNPENKSQVNHKNGIKINCAVDNLEWNTASENLYHAFKNGIRTDKGDNHYNCKIKQTDKIEIKRLKREGVRLRTIAQRYNVSESLISQISNLAVTDADTF